ncbi:hypothetical protein [Amycolatopsis dongchuanensis]|uniref:Secreted protein n=1 Tax=Amycolatopsis dongchuanensis TaxID=1070866 RepID=A0ABP9QJY4_9PSEU
MRGRTLLRVAAWAAATALGMAMSWFGVHSVLSADASGDAPQAIPVTAPTPSPTLAPPTSTTTRSSSPPPTSSTTRTTTSTPPPVTSSSAAGDVRAYQLTGGRVVLELGATSAKLVSATPAEGWQVQAWQADGWLRVDFRRDGTTSSCFVTWNGHPPSVQTT